MRFRSDAPPDRDGKRAFSAGDLAVREGDQTRIFRGADAEAFLAQHRLPTADARFQVNTPAARILRADYEEFVERQEVCRVVEEALNDDRTYVTSLTGVGGAGKTALACWAVLRAYNAGRFTHFISVSAKDRSLTSAGIRSTAPSLNSFDDILDQTLEILGFAEYRNRSVDEKRM